MNAFQCDFCGELFRCSQIGTLEYTKNATCKVLRISEQKGKSIDLCPTCRKILQKAVDDCRKKKGDDKVESV